MARPIKAGMDYFPHDVDARNDIKIKKLRFQYGIEGYGVYFMVLEMIYRSKNYELSLETEEDIMILADECRLDIDKFTAIIEKCCELGLFDKDLYLREKILSSNAVKKRTETVENKRNRNKKYYSAQKEEVPEENKESFSQVSEAETNLKSVKNLSESTQRKEKESKEKKNKSKAEENKNKINNNFNSADSAAAEKNSNHRENAMSIYDYFTHCGYGTLHGIMIEQLDDLVENYSEPWVKSALKEGAAYGKRSMAYVESILRSWKASGCPKIQQSRDNSVCPEEDEIEILTIHDYQVKHNKSTRQYECPALGCVFPTFEMCEEYLAEERQKEGMIDGG